jgi:hypothetical protein
VRCFETITQPHFINDSGSGASSYFREVFYLFDGKVAVLAVCVIVCIVDLSLNMVT